jgi:peptidyl-prolyl cis-trans isomerase C
MNKLIYAVVISGLLALTSGCADDPGTGDAGAALVGAPQGPVVATVNGEALTTPLLDVFARGRGLDPTEPAQRQKALDQLVETVLLAQDARAAGLLEDPEVQAEVALARLLQLSGRRIAAYRDGIQVGEPELQAYYRQEVERAGTHEFHLQHILFASEDAALAAAGRALQPGADFEALMGEYAVAGSGAEQARDLGWANLTQLPAEIGAAAAQMADGQTAPVPVRTSFGWHVLRRVESRPFQAPAFDQVRAGARRQLVERAIADKVKALRAQADIALPGQPQG